MAPDPMTFDLMVIGAPERYGNGDMSGELDGVKSVLLYGDTIAVVSFRPAFLFARMMNQIRTSKQRLAPYLETLDPADLRSLRDAVTKAVRARGGAEAASKVALFDDPAFILDLPDMLAEYMRDREIEVDDTAEFFRSFSEDAVRRWVDFKPEERSVAAVVAMKDMNRLFDAGVVTIDPGPLGRLLTLPSSEVPEEATRLLSGVVAEIYGPDSGRVPVLAQTDRVLIADNGDFAASAPTYARARDDQVAIAAQLLGALPNLTHLGVDELLDLRAELAPHRARFRAAIASLDAELSGVLREENLQAAIADIRVRLVDPEVEALNETLRDNRLLPTAARALPITGSGIVGLAVTTIVGGPLLAAAAALALGLGGAAAREYLRRQEQESQRTAHRFFLLHRAGRAS